MNCRCEGLEISEEALLFFVAGSEVTRSRAAPAGAAGVAGTVVCGSKGEGVGISGVRPGTRRIESRTLSSELLELLEPVSELLAIEVGAFLIAAFLAAANSPFRFFGC